MAGNPQLPGFKQRYYAIHWIQKQIENRVARQAQQQNKPELLRRFKNDVRGNVRRGATKAFAKELSGPWVPYEQDHDALRAFIVNKTRRRELPEKAPGILEGMLAGENQTDIAKRIEAEKSPRNVRFWISRVKAIVPEFYESIGKPQQAQEFRDKITQEHSLHRKRTQGQDVQPPPWPAKVPADDEGKLALLEQHFAKMYPGKASEMARVLRAMYNLQTTAEIARQFAGKYTPASANAMVREWKQRIANYLRMHAQRLGDQNFIDRMLPALHGNQKSRARQMEELRRRYGS